MLSILVPALGRARAQAQLLKDGTQVKSIGTGWINWTGDHDGYYPVPGLEKRLEDNVLGDIPKRCRPRRLPSERSRFFALTLPNEQPLYS